MNKQNPSAWQTLKPLFAFIKPYKTKAFLALVALLITAGLNLSVGQGVKLVIDNGFVAGSNEQLQDSILIMLGLITLISIGTYCRFYLMSWLGERISGDIRLSVFKRLVNLHPSYFESNRQGEIMSRLTTDTTLLQSIIGSSFSMALRSILLVIGGVIMLLVTNFKLTLIVLFCVPLVLMPMMIYGRRVRKLSEKSQDSVAQISVYAGEVIQNIKIVQSYNRQQGEQQAFAQEVETTFQVSLERIRQRAALFAMVMLLTFGAISGMLWVGGLDVLAGRMSGGELGAFVFYAILVALSTSTVAEVYGELQRAAGAGKRLVELMNIQSDIKNIDNPINLNAQTKPQIEFKNVSFNYPSRPDTPALENLNLIIPAGKSVALVGPSGAGKSTVFELLQRFYDPQQGEICLDGHTISHIDLEQLRQSMAIVPQQPTLFSHNVIHNIRYGAPHASDEQVFDAAKKAHADEFIEQLPDQYESFLGEQGVRLSGGQKQRVAIARAMLKDPQILLLDEATSALDAQSEHHVQSALNELMANRTTVIIAHRLATVLHADIIVVMDQGKIVASGTHQSLLKSSSLYQRLCELQFDSANEQKGDVETPPEVEQV